MLIINSLTIVYSSKLSFTDVNLNLSKGNRYSLGGNGTGKSTFLKVLMGEEEVNFGEVTILKEVTGWLVESRSILLRKYFYNKYDDSWEKNIMASDM